jgi:hypothetical protein
MGTRRLLVKKIKNKNKMMRPREFVTSGGSEF